MILMVEERINKLELDVENIKTRLDYKKDEIHEHDTNIANITKAINELRTIVISYHERTDQRIRMIEDMNKKCEKVDKKLEALEAKIDERNRIIGILVIPGIIACIDVIVALFGQYCFITILIYNYIIK